MLLRLRRLIAGLFKQKIGAWLRVSLTRLLDSIDFTRKNAINTTAAYFPARASAAYQHSTSVSLSRWSAVWGASASDYCRADDSRRVTTSLFDASASHAMIQLSRSGNGSVCGDENTTNARVSGRAHACLVAAAPQYLSAWRLGRSAVTARSDALSHLTCSRRGCATSHCQQTAPCSVASHTQASVSFRRLARC